MAKQSGMGMSLAVDDASSSAQTISNDATAIKFSTPRDVQDVTGLDKSALERIFLLADFSVEINGVYNTSANKSHAVFSTIPSTSVTRTVTIGVGGKFLAGEMLLTDYALERGDDGGLTFTVPGVLADGTAPSWT